MTLDGKLLVREADRLVERTARQLRRYRSQLQSADRNAHERDAIQRRVRELELGLKRLELYRSLVKNSPNSQQAMLPEFLEASGLMPKGTRSPQKPAA